MTSRLTDGYPLGLVLATVAMSPLVSVKGNFYT